MNNKFRDTDESLSAAYSSYRSHIAPRSTTITRRANAGGPTRLLQTIYSSSSSSANSAYATNTGFGGGVPLKPKNATVVTITENREREKRELVVLNDKFASYVERVRFLEVHNKKLQIELDALKSRTGGEAAKIREMYEIELKEAKNLIDTTGKDKANAEVKARQCEEDVERFKKRYADVLNNRNADKARIEDLNKQLANNEAEINLLRRRLADLQDEAKRYKVETQRLLGEIQRITADLDTETIQRIQLDNEKNALEEELNFLRQRHSQELEELRHHSFKDVGLDSSQFFKSELANAIREIRGEYEAVNHNQQADMEQWYRMKIQEVQTRNRPSAAEAADSVNAREEARRIRSAVTDQRRECALMKARNAELDVRIREIEELLHVEQKEGQTMLTEKDREIAELRQRQASLLADYEDLIHLKTNLEDEIQTYRQLLEGHGNKDGLKQVIESIEDRARHLNSSAATGVAATTSSYSFSIQSTSGGGARYVPSNFGGSSSESSAKTPGTGTGGGISSVSKLKFMY